MTCTCMKECKCLTFQVGECDYCEERLCKHCELNNKGRHMKYTKKEVQGMFSRLVKAIGKNADSWLLDYVSVYGGYVIEQVEENGGISHPFCSTRRNAKEMYLSMWMTCQALEDIKYEQELLNRRVV